ncbi:FAD-dependent oxidoreductase [Celeribacter sp. PS-C1]|nr:FAD-dependent oxidoreductase [Celeribacter sp. PS-C1]
MVERLVIVGAGMASGRLLDHLTGEAPDAFDITLFNAEPRGTYDRLMLSPVLAGEKCYAEIVTHDDAWYAKNDVTCRFGEWVHGIDRDRKVVIGEKGEVPYDKLVIATGSTPFIVPLPGHDLPGVIAYRDLEDTEEMMRLGDTPGTRAVVIGGGLLGLEAAAGMAARGVHVTVVHLNGHLMDRQLDCEAAGLLRRALEARGIEVVCSANSKEIIAGDDGRVSALLLEDGRRLHCDLLVMAVGIRPSITLAQAAGIETGRGVIVDDQLLTSDPNIFALGECVEHDGALFGLVAPLFEQAKVLAKTLCGEPAHYVNKEVSTKLKVTGCDLFSAGDFRDGEGRECITYSDAPSAVYKRLVIENDRLIGAVMYGDTNDGAWFFNLIREGADVSAMREMMIFGPAYQDAPPPPPIPAPVLLEAIA